MNKTSPKYYMWDIPVEMKPSDIKLRIRCEVMSILNEMTDRPSKSHTFGLAMIYPFQEPINRQQLP